MAGVEFLGTDGVDDADAELATGPHRRRRPADRRPGGGAARPRHRRLGGVGPLAAAVRTRSPATSVAPVPQPSVVDIPGRWRVPGLRASDPVAADPQLGESYALSGGHDLYSVGPTGGLLSYRRADTAHGRLVVDTVHHVVWVLPGDGEPAALEAYAATTLRTVAATYVHAPVAAGGVLDGRLYVTLRTSPAAARAGERADLGLVPAVDGAGRCRHRRAWPSTPTTTGWSSSARPPGGRTRLWFWSAIGGWTRGKTDRGGRRVDRGAAGHAVARRHGRTLVRRGGPVLLRLEPSEISPDLGRGPDTRYVLAAGRFALLVRDRTDGSAWCIDPETSEVQQRWAHTTALVSTSQNVLTVAAGRLVPLDRGACLG